MTTFALLPSPYLGASTWRPVALALAERGNAAYAVELDDQPPSSAQDALDDYLRSLPEGDELVLVPHSNAGLYVPGVAATRSVSAVVFVDAALPRRDEQSTPVAPRTLLQSLAERADEGGLLPPWTRWWDDADVAALFPDDATRDLVESDERRLPMSYVQDSVPVPAGWERVPCGYLALSAAYDDEAHAAVDLGWPVQQLHGGHLEMLVRPAVVALTVLQLLDAVRGR